MLFQRPALERPVAKRVADDGRRPVRRVARRRRSGIGWRTLLAATFGALLPAAVVPQAAHPAGPERPVLGSGHARAPARPAAPALPKFHPVHPGFARFNAHYSVRFSQDSVPVRAARPARPAAPSWYAPAPGAAISQPFGVPDSEYAAGYHTGVDFAVDVGTPLLAVGSAVVETARYGGAYGRMVVLRLLGGQFALYAHMSVIRVGEGQPVTAGQCVGLSGNTGNTTGPHLHFEIRTIDEYGAVVDPIRYLSARGARNF
ncbi:murein DD-endopeptidase MepM/ murein hydrolase activator NlpD [Streptacidiphilus sp. MAP12-16]|uniref:M23 family metallopeptidase n=1 Tax=Streptacidiphilus sp. MAP12-16 TaxID=3156300 RepID=UPI0035170EC4